MNLTAVQSEFKRKFILQSPNIGRDHYCVMSTPPTTEHCKTFIGPFVRPLRSDRERYNKYNMTEEQTLPVFCS